VHISFLTLRLC